MKCRQCGSPTLARGLCSKHYQRWRKTADPSIIKKHAASSDVLAFLAEAVAYRGSECLFWPYGKSGYSRGYYGVATWGGKQRHVHLIVCEAANGRKPSDLHEVAHNCGNSMCVAPSHLRWATRSGNQNDRTIHGTSNRGERQGASKLTRADVAAIRALEGRETQRDVADKFGVCSAHVCNIWHRKVWHWLP